jgi:hypothetical protein
MGAIAIATSVQFRDPYLLLSKLLFFDPPQLLPHRMWPTWYQVSLRDSLAVGQLKENCRGFTTPATFGR